MTKIDFAAMNVAELVAIQKEITQVISSRTQIESMQSRLNFKTGDKAKVLTGRKMHIGKTFELLNVGKTRAKITVEAKDYFYPLSWLEKVVEEAPKAEAKAKK